MSHCGVEASHAQTYCIVHGSQYLVHPGSLESTHYFFLVVPPVGLTGVGAAESDPRGDTNLLEDYLVRLVAASNIGGLVCCVGVVFRGR